MTDKLFEEKNDQEITETLTFEAKEDASVTEVTTESPIDENEADVSLEETTPSEDLAVAPLGEAEVASEEETLVETQEISQVEKQANEMQEAQGVLSVVDASIFSKMTKRNQQFMITLDKNLVAANLTAEVRRDVYTELCETLVEGQHTGQTARQLYGTPTECAQTILKQQFPSQDTGERSPDLHLAIDGGLVLGSLYTLITAFMMMRGGSANNTQIGLGIITLVVNYIMAGVAMMYTSRNMPDMDAPGRKKGYMKYFAISIATMGLWIFAVTASSLFIPKSINVTLPAIAYLIIGAITFGLHFYVKKRWNIRGGIF